MLGAFRFDEEFQMAVDYIAPALLTKLVGGLQILVLHLALGAQNEVRYAYFPGCPLHRYLYGRDSDHLRVRRTIRSAGSRSNSRDQAPSVLQPARRR